ncbi:MAG TPA: 50S ribosomal protein L24 [Candidatus Saccharimonadia bacterium]
MKLLKGDKVLVITGRDKGKTGTVQSVLPKTNQVLVENINVVKRHTKPSQKSPRGGILEVTKPIDVSKVMAVDPTTGHPARIGYTVRADGSKERTFKVSPNHAKRDKKAPKTEAKQTTKPDKSAKADQPVDTTDKGKKQ